MLNSRFLGAYKRLYNTTVFKGLHFKINIENADEDSGERS